VIEITVAEALRNVVHKNLVLVRADTPDEAHRKAIGLGQKSETSYRNPKDRLVHIRFRGVSKLDVMYEDLEDGAELTFEKHVGVVPEDIEQMIPPKERLQVFIAPTPGREHDPDYRSKAVIKMAVERAGSKGGRGGR
jgi:hypothetical protein